MPSVPNAASDAAPPRPGPASLPVNINNNETPRKSLVGKATQNITDQRKDIGKEMDKEFVKADFDAFLAAYLPFVPQDSDVDKCFEQMRVSTNNKPLIKSIPLRRQLPGGGTTIEDRLSFYFAGQVQRPNRPVDNEKKVFAKLDPIAKAIGGSSIEGRNRQYKFFDCPNVSIASDIAGSSNKIDACFVPDEFKTFDVTERLRTGKIAVSCEWKLGKNKIIENNRQVLSANVQMTNCDVCRMFSFGISIDGDQMRLWYFSRSHSAVSEPVDYIQNPKLLIKVFMSFMFATPNEMGFDPTITRHSDGSFTYKVSASPRRYFRSIDCISEVRSNNITGRMTRVWSVKEVDSMSENAQLVSDHTYVLKDVWLDETARTEKEIQGDIFEDIERFWDSSQDARKDREQFRDLLAAHEDIVTTGEYKKYFLAIEVDSTEQVTKKTVSNERVYNLFKNKEISSVRGSQTTAAMSRTKAHIEQQSTRPAESKKPIARDFAPKKQYRVVFKEKCDTVGHLKTIGEVFDVVKQILIPLQLMFCAGWVHRDISAGNILAYKPTETSDWIAKLSDLEYAKRFPPATDAKPHKDPKTGTAFFMPTEILKQIYLNKPPLTAEDEQSQKDWDNFDFKAKMKGLQYGVIHNFQHDLESLWWLLLWSMTFRVDHGPSQEYAKSIFVDCLYLWKEREEAFTCSIFEELEEALIGPGATSLAKFMEFERRKHNLEYKQREVAGLIRQPSSYISVHMQFQNGFQKLYDNEDPSWRSIKLRTTSSDPSAPDKSKQSSSNQVETGQNSGTEDIPSTSGSGRIEQPESLGKRPRSLSEDEEEREPDPDDASDQDEDDRPRKLMRLA